MDNKLGGLRLGLGRRGALGSTPLRLEGCCGEWSKTEKSEWLSWYAQMQYLVPAASGRLDNAGLPDEGHACKAMSSDMYKWPHI